RGYPGSVSCGTTCLGTATSGFVVRGPRTPNVGFDLNEPTAYCTFYVFWTYFPSSLPEVFAQAVQANNGLKLELRISSDGLIRVYNQGATLVATASSIAMQINTWYKIGLRVGTGSAAFWQVRINDQNYAELEGTTNLGSANVGAFRFGKYVNRNGQGIGSIFADILVDNASHFTGDYRTAAFYPNADVAGGQWSGGFGNLLPFSLTDDVNFIGSTTYFNLEEYTHPTFAGNGITDVSIGSMLAVKTIAVARRTAQNTDLGIVTSNTTNQTTTTVGAVNSTYEGLELFALFDPAGDPWNKNRYEAVTMGVRNMGTANRPIRVTSMAQIVAYVGNPLPPIVRPPRSRGWIVG
ncbi:MAG: hypothetical protein ACKOET_13200, partial [Verrucomicrobiota bacterium]